MMEAVLFYILAATTIAGAIVAITRMNPLASALWVVVTMLAVGGIFGLLAAPIVALFQILLAAGAIMVLFVFVIMLVNLDPASFRGRMIRFGKVVGAFAAAYLVVVAAIALFRGSVTAAPGMNELYEAPATLGRMLVSQFAIPFELISITLLIAMIGAVVLAKRELH